MAYTAVGYDYAFNHPNEALLAANADFVCRYLYPRSQYDADDAKNLSKTEADRLIKLGLKICSNYEWYAERAGEGYAAGQQDAAAADAQHRDCGGPGDRPIYFSVDYDANPPTVAPYFQGVASVIGVGRTGAYGSYKVIKYLFDTNLIKWGWQTYAWSAGQFDERSQLSQDQNGLSLWGGDLDLDHAHTADYGQWPGITEDDMSAADVAAIIAAVNKHTDQQIAAMQARMDHSFTLVYYGDSKEAALGIPDSTGKVPNQTHPWNITDNQQVGLAAIEDLGKKILAALKASGGAGGVSEAQVADMISGSTLTPPTS